jgi:hydroxyacylglutathione hydrolase
VFIRVFSSGPLGTNAILIGCKKTKYAAEHLVIKKILLTHSHWDHIADAHLLKEKTGALLFVHSLDAPNVIKPGSDALPLFFPIKGVQPDGFLEEGKAIDLGHLHIEVIHTPGHSPGGVCFYLKDQNVLISGDTLFRGSIGRLDLPTGKAPLMWKSLEKIQALPPQTRVIPGHGEETTLANESWLSHAKEMFS